MNKKFGLGKGLDALIQDYSVSSSLQEIPLDQIKESPYQPRLSISKESLEELVESIEENGIIDPLVVRKKNNSYELIAGHRRLSALKILNKEVAPVYILEVSDQKAAELTVVENIQRLDLNPVELAKSIQQMLQRFNLTHDQLAKTLGKSRVYITNTLRLLGLDESSIEALQQQQISEGHGRLILQISDPETRKLILHKIIEYQWSVKQLSDYIKKLNQNKKKKENHWELPKKEVKGIEKKFSLFFNTPVKIKGKKIEFYFKEESDFKALYNIFNSFIKNTNL